VDINNAETSSTLQLEYLAFVESDTSRTYIIYDRFYDIIKNL